MTTLSLDQASLIVDTALAKGRELDLKPLSVVVLDNGANLKAFKREASATPNRRPAYPVPVRLMAAHRLWSRCWRFASVVPGMVSATGFPSGSGLGILASQTANESTARTPVRNWRETARD